MSKNHARACLRKTVAALGQWQSVTDSTLLDQTSVFYYVWSIES